MKTIITYDDDKVVRISGKFSVKERKKYFDELRELFEGVNK